MEIVLGGLAAVAAAVGLSVVKDLVHRGRERTLGAAARALALEPGRTGPKGPAAARGRVAGLPVSVSLDAGGVYSIHSDGEGAVPRSIQILGRPTSSTRFPFEVTIDAGELDDSVGCRGSADRLYAVLDRETRQLMIERDPRIVGFTLTAGVLEVRLSATGVEAKDIQEAVLWAVQLMQRMSVDRADIPGRILQNVKNERDAGVRERMLLTLLERFPGSELETLACQLSLREKDFGLHVLAAERLGRAGLHHLRWIVESDAAPDHVRALALKAIAERLSEQEPIEVIAPIILTALDSSAFTVRIQAIEAAATKRIPQALPLILHRITLYYPDGQLSPMTAAELRHMAIALGHLGAGQPAAEEALIALLDAVDPQLRISAAKALGIVGTVRAVPPLLENQKGTLLALNLQREIRNAVALIQSRIAGAGTGQLSLAAPSEGQGALSVAFADPSEGQGALSVAPDRGALSFFPDSDERPPSD